FGQPVAFKNFLVEPLLEIFREIEWQCFRAGDDETQTAEVIRVHFSQIASQKSRRRQQKRQVIAFNRRRVFRRFERVWISDRAHRFNQRIPKGDGRSKAVEKWE